MAAGDLPTMADDDLPVLREAIAASRGRGFGERTVAPARSRTPVTATRSRPR